MSIKTYNKVDLTLAFNNFSYTIYSHVKNRFKYTHMGGFKRETCIVYGKEYCENSEVELISDVVDGRVIDASLSSNGKFLIILSVFAGGRTSTLYIYSMPDYKNKGKAGIPRPTLTDTIILKSVLLYSKIDIADDGSRIFISEPYRVNDETTKVSGSLGGVHVYNHDVVMNNWNRGQFIRPPVPLDSAKLFGTDIFYDNCNKTLNILVSNEPSDLTYCFKETDLHGEEKFKTKWSFNSFIDSNL